ncbi:hypothetical protein SLE2022_405610 [Rubroshorea leprosula]
MAAIDGDPAPRRARQPQQVDAEIVEPADEEARRREQREFPRGDPRRRPPIHGSPRFRRFGGGYQRFGRCRASVRRGGAVRLWRIRRRGRRRRAGIEQRRRLDPIERAAPREIAPRGADPCRRRPACGKPQHLGERPVDLPRLEHPLRARDAIGRHRRGLVRAADRHHPRHLATERLPPAVVRVVAGKLRRHRVEPVLKVGKRHRLAGGRQDGGDGGGLAAPEPLAQQALDIAELEPAIERAARGEGDEQPFGAAGVARGGARLRLDVAHLLAQLGDRNRWWRDRRLRAGRGRGRAAGSRAAWRRASPPPPPAPWRRAPARARRRGAARARSRSPPPPPPPRTARTRAAAATASAAAPQAPRHTPPSPSARLIAQLRRRRSSAASVGRLATATARQPPPLAPSAARLIAATATPARAGTSRANAAAARGEWSSATASGRARAAARGSGSTASAA